MSLAVRSVIPMPPAEFSPLTTIRSGAYLSRSEGIVSRSPRRPGPPTTSPMKSSRMAASLVGAYRDGLCQAGRVAAEPDTEELVRRALAYPYDPPAGSYVQLGGRTLPVPPEEIDVAGRRALLAYGANASPEALTRKLS